MSETSYIVGDTRAVLATMPAASVDLVLSSPPFLALRSYLPADHPDKHLEMGSEANPAAFLDALLEVTALCRRVLTPTGTLAFELGDTYATSRGRMHSTADVPQSALDGSSRRRAGLTDSTYNADFPDRRHYTVEKAGAGWPLAKSLCMIPEAYRMSLAYGRNILTGQPSPAGQWRVRNVVRWCRPNPPVGSLGDKFRPATSEMVIACTSAKRWFDLDAVRAPGTAFDRNGETKGRLRAATECAEDGSGWMDGKLLTHNPAGAPPLDWWEIPTGSYPGSHYATFPTELLRIPILAMCPARVCRTCGEPSRRIVEPSERYASRPNAGRDFLGVEHDRGQGKSAPAPFRSGSDPSRNGAEYVTLGWTDCGHDDWRRGHVLDPFGGSGTTGVVSNGHGRDCTLIDLDARNLDLARERVGMFLNVVPQRPVVDVRSELF